MSDPLVPFDMPDAEMEAQVPERFSVVDEGSANWVIRRIVEARAYAERVAAWAQIESRRARREEAFFLLRFGGQLEAWAQEQIAQRGGRQKSLNLPSGRIGFRTAPPKLVIYDESALLAWARQHCPQAVEAVERVRKVALNEHFTDTGEIPPGAKFDPQHQTIFIK